MLSLLNVILERDDQNQVGSSESLQRCWCSHFLNGSAPIRHESFSAFFIQLVYRFFECRQNELLSTGLVEPIVYLIRKNVFEQLWFLLFAR